MVNAVTDLGCSPLAPDNYAILQAYINSLAIGGRAVEIYFPSVVSMGVVNNIYNISNTLNAGARRFSFRGEGCDGAYGTCINQTNPNKDILVDPYDIFSAYGLVFQGTGAGTGTGKGLVIGQAPHGVGQQSSDCRISHCWFDQIPDYAIWFANSADTHIENCGLETSGGGIFAQYADYMKITNNMFWGLQKAAIRWQAGSSLKIRGNHIALCGGTVASAYEGGVVFETTGAYESNGLEISGNTFEQNLMDISLVSVPAGSASGHAGLTQGTINGNFSKYARTQSMCINGPANLEIVDNVMWDANYGAHAGTSAVQIYNSAGSRFARNTNKMIAAAPNRVSYGLYVDPSCTTFRLGNNNRMEGTIAAMSVPATAQHDSY